MAARRVSVRRAVCAGREKPSSGISGAALPAPGSGSGVLFRPSLRSHGTTPGTRIRRPPGDGGDPRTGRIRRA
ncbi:hypothetical protein GCM10010517_40110 [Streptosporangium fragile]|uniref:Uncharacterized protein n=1 Tax=Streptosporangium fragile TaxID=46186 RepID=A0ABN3W014_9ACTN